MGTMYDKIYALCEKKGVKPGTVCREIGIRRSVLTEMKAGRTKELSAKNAKLIADYFEVPADYFFSDENVQKEIPTKESGEVETYIQREKMKLLIHSTKDLSDDEIEKVIQMIKIMKGK